MEFISSKGILHLDLATRNVLLTHPEEMAKISDFGLSRSASLGKDGQWKVDGECDLIECRGKLFYRLFLLEVHSREYYMNVQYEYNILVTL